MARAFRPAKAPLDMSSALQQQLLDARDRRQARIDRASAASEVVLVASVNIPGADKSSPDIVAWFDDVCAHLRGHLNARELERDIDSLGPWAMYALTGAGERAKAAAVHLEQTLPAGRLLDLDIYARGSAVSRSDLHLAPRSCLVCDQPAVDCIRSRRHASDEAVRAAEQLILGWRATSGTTPTSGAAALARCLETGARAELDLTPKPGLVDRLDNGSHPDLNYGLMARSIDLLPQYYDDLLHAHDIGAAVDAGRRAERRMSEVVGSNTHRGYIFLSGLLLIAEIEDARVDARRLSGDSRFDALRHHVRRVADRVLTGAASPVDVAESHGAAVRRLGLGGVHREALDGLPSVFEHGLAALQHCRSKFGMSERPIDRQREQHYVMAALMQVVEDTTAVHRCGLAGLERLRTDGRALAERIDAGRPYVEWLADLNRDYRGENLTMGGVADCLALTIAVDGWIWRA